MKLPKSFVYLLTVLAIATAPTASVAISPEPLLQKLSALSQAGNGEAAYHLGMLYHLGLKGASKDPRRAFELFELAAERGDPLGAYKIGCYFDGQGEGIVESNAKLALKYKMIAADAGYALAQFDVAMHLFREGRSDDAIRWLETAANQGNRDSLIMLATLYGTSLEDGATKGDEMASMVLRGLAPRGTLGVTKDPVKSYAYMRLALADVQEMKGPIEAELGAKLTPEQRRQADEIVGRWAHRPSVLTQKASSGLAAAFALAGLPVPKD